MIDKRIANSVEMQKNIKIVKKMSSVMSFDENMDSINWKSIRFISNIGYMFMPKEKGVKFKKNILNNRKCVVAVPEKEVSSYIIMYIHGGGFVSGSSASSKGYCSMLAKYGECKVVSVDYSLSPENKYPVALNDCVKVYEELTRRYTNNSIALVGESAGASLCLTTCHKIIAEKLKKPCCLIVHSPFVDFNGSLDRTINTVDDFTVKEGCLKPLQSIYAGEEDLKSPYISPIYADYKDFPPLFITCDSNETLYADSYYLYQKALDNGVNVRMVEMKNAFHAFATIGTGTPETLQILRENIEFIREWEKMTGETVDDSIKAKWKQKQQEAKAQNKRTGHHKKNDRGAR